MNLLESAALKKLIHIGGNGLKTHAKASALQDVVEAIKQTGGEAFITKMNLEGVRIEE